MTTATTTRPGGRALLRLLGEALDTPLCEGETPADRRCRAARLTRSPRPGHQALYAQSTLHGEYPFVGTWRLLVWAVDWRACRRDAHDDVMVPVAARLAHEAIADTLRNRGRAARTAARIVRRWSRP